MSVIVTGGPAFQLNFFPILKRGCPVLAFFGKGGNHCRLYYGLHARLTPRTYGALHLHFITCSCYHRRPKFRSLRSRDRFLSILEQTRQRYRFVVVGYVVMPEHFHLLITEPEVGTSSTVMQVLKQRTAHALLPKKRRVDSRQQSLFPDMPRLPFWQARFYDFNVWAAKKRIEKLRYMHRNPVKRGLVGSPEEWQPEQLQILLAE